MEEWKDIEGYEGLYQISNYGQVKSLTKERYMPNGGKRVYTERLVAINVVKSGYLNVQLWKDGKVKNKMVHILVAMAFIPNPNNYPQVNHKDEDKTNPIYSNLEWCTRSYNATYGTAIQRRLHTLKLQKGGALS